jgi:multidrug resistance protein
MFAPGVPLLLREFKSTSSTLGSLVVSVYVLGYAFGPLIIAPMSEIYGRQHVYNVTNVLFVIFTVACAVSSSLGMLIGFRFLCGMMGSTPITIGGGTNADMFRTEERGTAMAIWSIGPLLGPVIGPVAGSFLSQAKGWRWDFWVLTILVSCGGFRNTREV